MKIRGTDFVYYQTSDIEKSIEFYRDTLGLEMYGYFEEVKWAEFNAGNATFAINDPTVFDANLKPPTRRRCRGFRRRRPGSCDQRARG